ncbi:polyphosphate kinase [soil metagenome]
MVVKDKINTLIEQSNFISRDLSWLKFNYRVLDQAKKEGRTILEKLKFLAITSSNQDEFFMIRVGSLYNYIDYGKQRIDYSGLREIPFKKKLFLEAHSFFNDQNNYYINKLLPCFKENGFEIKGFEDLEKSEVTKLKNYFKKTIYPMLTPMVYDSYHTFPILMNKLLILGVVTKSPDDKKDLKKLSFIQIPQNLPRFYEIEREDSLIFIPIEEIIRKYIDKLFRNVEIIDVNLFRITRNGDFSLEESDDIEANFLEEMQRKLKTRKTGRVVRIEVEASYNKWMMRLLKTRWELDDDNIFKIDPKALFDYTGLWQIIGHRDFKYKIPPKHPTVYPVTYPKGSSENLFEVLKNQDIMLHHPYNSIWPVIELIERAAEDPCVLGIKLTIYRLAKESRITTALLKAAENGKHVSVLFEVKARFDEENNMREAKKLQSAGCFVIYGISSFKTHTKLLLIVRKEGEKVTRYVHMSSGNYNEDTSGIYTDLGLLTTNETYAHDVSEFFNVITGHSLPQIYKYLITAPGDMRQQLIELIRTEASNASQGLPSGIVIKINSLEDKSVIEELYLASQAGVPIKLIVRGICCLRPGRKDLSENISIISIVGDFLEHSRIYYFHNNGDPKVYGGSADIMVRSFERRLESLFLLADEVLKKQAINLLKYNLKDNVNTYIMQEDGNYIPKEANGEPPFNIHKEFFEVTMDIVMEAKLF